MVYVISSGKELANDLMTTIQFSWYPISMVKVKAHNNRHIVFLHRSDVTICVVALGGLGVKLRTF